MSRSRRLRLAVELLAEAVDDRRIRLQAHALRRRLRKTEAQRSIGGAAGLLFDDRRQDQRLVGRSAEVRARAAHAAARRCCMVRYARASIEASVAPVDEIIGVGKKPAFGLAVRRTDLRISSASGRSSDDRFDPGVVLQRGLEIAKLQPSTMVNAGLRDIALRQLGEQARERRARGNLVIAGLDRAIAGARCAPRATSVQSAGNHAVAASSRATERRRRARLDGKRVRPAAAARAARRRPPVGSRRKR